MHVHIIVSVGNVGFNAGSVSIANEFDKNYRQHKTHFDCMFLQSARGGLLNNFRHSNKLLSTRHFPISSSKYSRREIYQQNHSKMAALADTVKTTIAENFGGKVRSYLVHCIVSYLCMIEP